MSKVVLVVEDNEDNLLIAATILRHHGYEVLTAVDGEAAVVCATEENPDLILLDISLPRMDGWSVARLLKSNPDTTDVPIIAFTAHVYQSDRARAAEGGFVGFLTKPIEPARILAEVERAIGPA